ncbi:ethanolamine ammonia-lyase subunit EutC [Scopulibacillus cellulosilyticus]|uniref:Ethanolamine ammonia-lyase small subunit n=1 Tax=Scopulibacillus cellulosilyticus TaxID=2665665 RepID=A0ABW2PUL6_9BACL
MNQELVKEITKMVIGKLNEETKKNEDFDHSRGTVKIWDHTSSEKRFNEILNTNASITKEDDGSLVKFSKMTRADGKRSSALLKQNEEAAALETAKEIADEPPKNLEGVDHPAKPEELIEMMKHTPARIGIGRAGLRPKTHSWLKFRFDHAAAVDAVYGDVSDQCLNSLNLFKVNTKVTDKEIYIRRPDYGRKLSEEAKQVLMQKCKKSPTVQIVISDGLSSKAVEENVEDVYLSLEQSLKSLNIETGTPFFIEKGRVAVMDDVGELLKPKVIVLLIGERPGLVSAESLSAYLCYEPRIGTIEADRMVISNIHKGGIPPSEAGAYLGTVVQKILKYEASGVALVEKEE